jgi:hypothetical protein
VGARRAHALSHAQHVDAAQQAAVNSPWACVPKHTTPPTTGPRHRIAAHSGFG